MELNSIIINLTEIYPTEQEKIREIKLIVKSIEETKDKNKLSDLIEKLQSIVNFLYDLGGCDELIELQVLINEYRYEYDITDPREIINWDNGKGFVQ